MKHKLKIIKENEEGLKFVTDLKYSIKFAVLFINKYWILIYTKL